MAQAPQLNDSQLNLLAKIASNTGETQPKHGDGQHNLLFKIAQNTYASAVNGANIDISDVNGLQSALDAKVASSDPNYILVKPTDNLAEKYSQIKNYTPSTSSSLLNGLLAFYNLSDTSDASGNGNTLTNNGGVAFSNGKVGNAATFDGTNYFTTDIENTAKTVSAWVKTTSTESFNVIFENSNQQLQFVDTGELRVNGIEGEELAGSGVNDGNWHHCVFVLDESQNYIYLDNQKFTLSTSYANAGSGLAYMGSSGGIFDYWEGQLDALGVWGRALTDAEVTALYNAGHGIEHPFFRSATNRGTMFIVPGTYSLSSELAIDAEYVDIVGLGAQFQSPAVIVTNNTLNVTANDVRVSGISVGSQEFKIGSDKPLQVFENCVGGNNSFGGGGIFEVNGTFNSCVAGDESFGFENDFIGKCKNCVAGINSFGGGGGYFGGELISCRLIGAGASYPTPSGSGIIRFCLDGDNNIVNADAP